MDDNYEISLDVLKANAQKLQKETAAGVVAANDVPHDEWTKQQLDMVLLMNDLPEISFLETPSLCENMFYHGGFGIISGVRKGGKTWVAMMAAIDFMKHHGHVYYLDYESGATRVARRLLDLGADADDVATRFHYIYRDRFTETPQALANVMQNLHTFAPGSLVLIDAWRGFSGKVTSKDLKEHDENSSSSIERAMGPLAEAAALYDLTILLIDHPSKGMDGNSTYKVSGSGAKEAIANTIYFVEKHTRYGITTEGKISLVAWEDRDGALPTEKQFFKVGGQGKGRPFFIERLEYEDGIDNPEVAAAFEFIKEQAGNRVNGPDVWDAAGIKGGNTTAVGKALRALPTIESDTTAKPHVYWYKPIPEGSPGI